MALTIAISTLLDQSRRSWHAISRQQTDRDTGLTPLWSLPRSKVFTVLREADLPHCRVVFYISRVGTGFVETHKYHSRPNRLRRACFRAISSV